MLDTLAMDLSSSSGGGDIVASDATDPDDGDSPSDKDGVKVDDAEVVSGA